MRKDTISFTKSTERRHACSRDSGEASNGSQARDTTQPGYVSCHKNLLHFVLRLQELLVFGFKMSPHKFTYLNTDPQLVALLGRLRNLQEVAPAQRRWIAGVGPLSVTAQATCFPIRIQQSRCPLLLLPQGEWLPQPCLLHYDRLKFSETMSQNKLLLLTIFETVMIKATIWTTLSILCGDINRENLQIKSLRMYPSSEEN